MINTDVLRPTPLQTSTILHRVCRRVLDRLNGNNNADLQTNGELALLKRVLPSVHCVLDVGANVGDWSAAALAINPNLEVHCFEPNPSTFAALSQRSLKGDVRLNAFALGAESAEHELNVYGELDGLNSLYERAGTTPVRRERIKVETLDKYAADAGIDEIGLLKIDTEGHELAVMRGAESMLRSGRIRMVQFEYGGTFIDSRTFLKDIWHFISALRPSYRFYKVHPAGLRFAPSYHPGLEDFQYSNWVIADSALD
jgi:FkbM family methyltransferase